MWSYHQYKQIGQAIDTDWAKRTNPEPNHSRIYKQLKSIRDIPPTECIHCQATEQLPKDQEKSKDEHPAHSQIHVKLDDDRDDPFDPHNWPLLSRCKNIAILTFLIFVQAWAAASESMANTEISLDLHVSRTTETLATAMYLFGVGSGSIFAGPISETVGRNATYLVGTFCYMLFVLGSGLVRTFEGQVLCRFFVGLFASATLAVNGSSVGDQFRSVKRSFVFPIIAWANVASRMMAPIAGGWIMENRNLNWRWTEYITLIISAAAFLLAFLFLPETHLPTLLEWKARHLRRVTGHQKYISEREELATFIRRMKKVLPMPLTFFSSEPVILVLGLYLVLLYILQFTFLSGFDYLFKQTYNLSTGLTGSCFGAIALGSTAFTFTAPALYSWARHKTEQNRGRRLTPEFRLWPAIIAGPFLPISLLWLGWTNQPSISIWSGLSACFLFGVILTAIYVSSYEYIIDSYGEHAAVALASITMARYLISGGMVLAARPMYEGLGVQWTMTLLAAVSAVLAPAPALFWVYGGKLRGRSPFALGDGD